jgi:acetyltransferase-like isoleucine patch superfamily enzyme
MRRLLQGLLLFFPWAVRRRVLQRAFGYRIDRTAHIGLAWVDPARLEMGPGSRIGHLTVCRGLDLLSLGTCATIGRLNWITGHPLGDRRHFAHVSGRRPELQLGPHAAITNRHLIDCTDLVAIGDFSTVAGFRSQFLTHSVDLAESRQSCAPIVVGRHCFVGSGCVALGGSSLPDRSVLGAASLLNRALTTDLRLYGGVPARELRTLDPALKYFHRSVGYVD